MFSILRFRNVSSLYFIDKNLNIRLNLIKGEVWKCCLIYKKSRINFVES